MEMADESISVPEWLLSAVARELDPWPSNWGASEKAVRKDSEVDLPRKLVEALVEHLSEDLVCDHNTGICMCSLIEVVLDLELALKGQRRCDQCGADPLAAAYCPKCLGTGALFIHSGLPAGQVTA